MKSLSYISNYTLLISKQRTHSTHYTYLIVNEELVVSNYTSYLHIHKWIHSTYSTHSWLSMKSLSYLITHFLYGYNVHIIVHILDCQWRACRILLRTSYLGPLSSPANRIIILYKKTRGTNWLIDYPTIKNMYNFDL